MIEFKLDVYILKILKFIEVFLNMYSNFINLNIKENFRNILYIFKNILLFNSVKYS